MSAHAGATRRITTHALRRMKAAGEKIAMVTAYDATFARLLDEAGAHALLVGDSLGNVIQGHDTTLPVTVDHIAYHTAAVARGARRAHIVADMPFLSCSTGDDDAVRNAGRLMREGGAHAVKVEGGREIATTVARIVAAGIPVMGHLGLTPQSVHQLGGFRVQGRDDDDAARLLEDARILQDAGAYALVLEMVPRDLARRVTDALDIPTIGIGAGPDTSGQVLVCYDLLGLNDGFRPKFLKTFAELGTTVRDATAGYIREVQDGTFPDDDHSFS
ncbi:MAG: 3-methyl-2-oxobutanoate hydroxymethyltransferase [Deltaproteobacteria bacterium]|nr:MAG: 3-methyl-2-oxobutanoate hydroxymethyltransferase [Deltaproteobacteria bacterium]